MHLSLAELYRRKVAALQQALDDPALRVEALTTLLSLIDYVEVTRSVAGCEVEFVGKIANMIKLPSGPIVKNLDNFESLAKRVTGAHKRHCHVWTPPVMQGKN